MAAGYRNKIDIIYIDPPYNTQLIQTYKDKYKRDAWLSSIKERLELAKELLSDDGIIFVSIDDSEQAYLKVLMDEIFGENNFIGMAIRKTRSQLNRIKNNFNIQHEYLLIYLKSQFNNFKFIGETKDLNKYKNLDNDPNGAWISDNPSIGLALSGKKSNTFPITNPYTQKIDRPPVNCHWRFTESKLKEHIESGKIKFKEKHKDNERGFIFKRYKKDLVTNYKTFNTLSFVDKKYLNQVATKELKTILNENETFFYPKPISFVKDILNKVDNKDAIILDFFAGSGTTGHAVMQLNQDDGGKRKFILCTNNEFIKDGDGNDTNMRIGDLCHELLHRIMKAKGKKDETDFQWKGMNKPFFNEKLKYWNIKKIDVSLAKQFNQIINEENKVTKFKNLIKEAYKNLNPSFDENNFEQEWINICLNLTLNSDIENKDVK